MTPKQWKRLFYRIALWATVLALLFLVITVAMAAWRIFIKGEEAARLKKGAEENLQSLYVRKAAVQEGLQKLDTPRGVEEEIRKRYELGKPGEEQIVLVADSSSASSTKGGQKGLWEIFLSWFSR